MRAELPRQNPPLVPVRRENSPATLPTAPICGEFVCDPAKIARWQGNIPPLNRVAELFKALADETRARILYLLTQEEMCVCDLATILGTTVSNVSHHLRLLRAQQLVKYRRAGKMVFYSLDDEHVLHLFHEAFDHAAHQG